MLMLLFVTAFSAGLAAQPSAGDAVAVVSPAEKYKAGSKSKKMEAPLPAYFRKQNALPDMYTGMAIELMSTDEVLPQDHALFRQFGGVKFKKLPNGRVMYYILLSFRSKKSAEEFTENIVKPRAPMARLVHFEKGKAKKVKKEA